MTCVIWYGLYTLIYCITYDSPNHISRIHTTKGRVIFMPVIDKSTFIQTITDKNVVYSQLTFGSVTGTTIAINGTVKEVAITPTSELAAQTIAEAPWLLDWLPEMVMDGSLIMKNGHLFLYGLSLMDIVSFTAIGITLTIAIAKFISDMRKNVRTAEENKYLKAKVEFLQRNM